MKLQETRGSCKLETALGIHVYMDPEPRPFHECNQMGTLKSSSGEERPDGCLSDNKGTRHNYITPIALSLLPPPQLRDA